MTRLLIHVEGETEETFVNEILAPHLYRLGYEKVGARLVGNSRHRHKRGGIRSWGSARNDIVKHLREDTGCLTTTMVDYYALPDSWPGRSNARTVLYENKANTVETAIHQDISEKMGGDFNINRFIPFVMMHEFEGLLFSDCTSFSRGIERPDLAEAFQVIRDQFDSPEEINDSPNTAPSKRIASIVNNYQKPLHGAFGILEIGLEAIRAECPHFNNWLNKLETSIRGDD